MGRPSNYGEEIAASICAELACGKSLSTVCDIDGMPSWTTVHAWMNEHEGFSEQVTRAREIGYLRRADKAIEDAKKAEDASLGRLAFDAERWYLGKLSNAFSDDKAKKLEHSGPGGGPIRTMAVEFVDGLPDQAA